MVPYVWTMENSVFIPGFCGLPSVMQPTAVYALLRAGKVVYVGKSTNVYARVARHWQNLMRIRAGKPAYDDNTIRAVHFDSVMVKFCAKADLDTEEFALIQRYMPQHNIMLKRVASKIDVAKIPTVAEIFARARERKRPTGFTKRQWGQRAAA